MQSEIISKTIKIKALNLPIKVDFIEEQIKLQKIEPIRWAIVDVKNNELLISVSGYEI